MEPHRYTLNKNRFPDIYTQTLDGVKDKTIFKFTLNGVEYSAKYTKDYECIDNKNSRWEHDDEIFSDLETTEIMIYHNGVSIIKYLHKCITPVNDFSDDDFPEEEFYIIIKDVLPKEVGYDDIPELMSFILFICSQSTNILDYCYEDTTVTMVITGKDDFSFSENNPQKVVTMDECKDFIKDKIKFM